MAACFGEIFAQVDGDLARFGIKSYTIRNMTLEQVFLAIRDEEIKQEERHQ